MIASKATPTGGPEAEALFQKALNHHLGRKGSPYDPVAAKELYIMALKKGSAKAALNLGRLLKHKATLSCQRADDLGHMVKYFVQAAKMGSPDALYCLHEACSQGLGVPKDTAKADRLLEEAAHGGSPQAMVCLGLNCISGDRVEEGKVLLAKAVEQGHGDAGYHLALLHYAADGDVDAMIHYLQQGAEKGNQKCLRKLAMIYELGQYGQKINPQLAEKYFNQLPVSKRRPMRDSGSVSRFAPPGMQSGNEALA